VLHIYIYNISRLRVKDLHSATYIYVVRRLRVKYSAIKTKLTQANAYALRNRYHHKGSVQWQCFGHIRGIQIRSKDSQVKTQLILQIFILFEVTS